jgi:hypothetical protein
MSTLIILGLVFLLLRGGNLMPSPLPEPELEPLPDPGTPITPSNVDVQDGDIVQIINANNIPVRVLIERVGDSIKLHMLDPLTDQPLGDVFDTNITDWANALIEAVQKGAQVSIISPVEI